MNRNFMLKSACLAAAVTGIAASAQTAQAQLTNGNIVVLQTGDGSAALSNAGTALFLKEYAPATAGQSAPVSATAIPSSGAGMRLVNSGTATSEGSLSLSQDSTKLVISGYDTSAGAAGVASSNSANILRVIDTVGAAGIAGRADTTSAFSGNNIRTAVKGIGEDYWAGGGNGGVQYLGNTAAAAALGSTITNIRVMQIFNGNIYYTSAASAGYGLYKIAGTPTAPTATGAQLFATGTSSSTSSPYGFSINAAETIAYIADDRSTGGGIQKWVNNSGTWTLANTLATGGGVRGLAVDWSGTYPVLYATTATPATANNLVKVIDSNFTSGSANSYVVLATAPANTAFRGVAFAPKTGCTAPTLSIASTAITCTGNGALTLTTTGGSAITGYSWTGPGTYTASTQNLSNLASGNYTVTVTTTGGCTATATATVANNATVTATATAVGATTVCQGDMVRLKATTGTGYAYQWYNGTTAISGATDTLYAATASGSYAVKVTKGNCNATSTAVAVTVNARPTATISPSAAQSICQGSSVALNANTGTGLTYSWLNNNAAISGATSATYTATAAGNYRVRVQNANGCFDTAAAVAVTVLPVPVATVTAAGATTVCQGDTVKLKASTATGNTYQWYNGTTAIANATDTLYAATATGSYAVKVTRGNCNATSTAVAVTVKARPVPVAAFSNGVLAITSGTGYTSYQWYNGTTAISGANSPTYPPVANGSYTVRVDSNGCTGTSAAVIVQGIGVNTVAKEVFSIFPNPTNGRVQITPAGLYHLTLTDLQGRVLMQQEQASYLDMSGLADGFYLLSIRTGAQDGKQQVRIYKQSK